MTRLQRHLQSLTRCVALAGVFAVAAVHVPAHAVPSAIEPTRLSATTESLAPRLAVGDVVFIRVPALPFRKIAAATDSWTNHVGIVLDVSGAEPVIAESRFPLSGSTPWSRFVARSEGGRVAVMRLNEALTPHQQQAIVTAAERRRGVFYDTGFDLHSRRQFCSRFVREVVAEATGTPLGEVETLASLFARQPAADLGFWRVWYFGSIPWQRQTVTPASLLRSDHLHPVFDGAVQGPKPREPAI